MTMLPPHAIEEFRALWNAKFGAELSPEQAIVVANRFITLVAHVVGSLDDNQAQTEASRTSTNVTLKGQAP